MYYIQKGRKTMFFCRVSCGFKYKRMIPSLFPQGKEYSLLFTWVWEVKKAGLEHL